MRSVILHLLMLSVTANIFNKLPIDNSGMDKDDQRESDLFKTDEEYG